MQAALQQTQELQKQHKAALMEIDRLRQNRQAHAQQLEQVGVAEACFVSQEHLQLWPTLSNLQEQYEGRLAVQSTRVIFCSFVTFSASHQHQYRLASGQLAHAWWLITA